MLAKLNFCFPLQVRRKGQPRSSYFQPSSFYSNLKQSDRTEEEYQTVIDKWKGESWTTTRNLLIYCKNLDTGPFVEKCVNFYESKRLDLFEQAFSARAITKRYLFTQAP